MSSRFATESTGLVIASKGVIDVGSAWMVAMIAVLLALLAFLAVAETAFTRITRIKAQTLAGERRTKSARALAALARTPERVLNALLLAGTIALMAEAFLGAILAQRLFGGWGILVAFFVNVVLVFVIAEALPKTWAVVSTERAALATALPLAALIRLSPLAFVSRALIGLANVLLPGKGLAQGPFVSEQELLGIVDAAVEDDVIEAEERELIESIITFGDTVAREVMVPRPAMVTVPATATITDALDVAIEHGFSRVPVAGESVDDVVGIAYTKDLVRAERTGNGGDVVSGVARNAHFVPETKPVARLMREMQSDKYHLAILVDEYGGIAGLVTLEDCLEELVGDIVDEYDTEDDDVVTLSDGTLRIDGGLGISDLNDLLGVDVPDDDWDTVGGFVFGTIGHVPTPGERFVHAGYEFVAEKVDGRRVARVLVSRVDGEPAQRAPSERRATGDQQRADA